MEARLFGFVFDHCILSQKEFLILFTLEEENFVLAVLDPPLLTRKGHHLCAFPLFMFQLALIFLDRIALHVEREDI